MKTGIPFLTALLSITPLLYQGCSNDNCSTCSEQESCDFPPGNRSFSWRLDTVAWWPSTLGGIHAFADDDAWVMGDMYGPVVNGKNTSYVALHWNGQAWDDTVPFTDLYTLAYDVAGDNHYLVAAGYLGYLNGEKPSIAEFDNRSKKWKAENAYYGSSQFETDGVLTSVWTDGKGFFIAVGWNGMVFTKDGYDADWVYTKAPTDFGFVNVTGISKNEIYADASQNLVNGEHFQQGWKYYNNQWIKLFDTKDSTATPIHLTTTDYPNQMGVWRCTQTDSLKIYVIGDQSYLFSSAGQQLAFQKINLAELGLPLKQNGRTGLGIFVFSPKDVWIVGTRFNFYHWDGNDFTRIFVPGLPDDDTHFGFQGDFKKTKSGKIFLPSEVSSWVWVIVQGTP